mgnify:CR=1 FL=1
MSRVKAGSITRSRHKKIIKQAKGYYGRRKNTFKTANQAVEKAGQYAYRDRKVKKREFESSLLKLNSSKANSILKWKCNLSFKESIYFTTEWYKYFYTKKKNMYDFSIKQINLYIKKLK